jgi:iron complex outermembrane recepter protein
MRKSGPATISLSALLASASYAQAPAGAPTVPPAQEADPSDSSAPEVAPAAPEAAPSAPEGVAGSQMGEIVVTAQRRAERLQDTPIAVTAVTAEAAQNLGLTKAVDIAAVTPGASFVNAAGFFSAYIRGLGVPFVSTGLESPVAVYEDGAYLPRTLNVDEILDNFDVGSIQVLRGPQGTLYGRNATGGVIIINSADPTSRLEGRVRGELGNFDHWRLDGMINVPLGEDLALRATGGYRDDEGYIDNLTTGEKIGRARTYSARAKLRWQPGSADIVLGGQYYDSRNTLQRTATLARNDSTCLACVLAPGIVRPSIGFYEQESDTVLPALRSKNYGANLKMDFDVGSFQLTSTTTYRRQKIFNSSGDSDATPLFLFEFAVPRSGGRTYTQDLQLASKLDGPFNYLFGLSYLNDRSNFDWAFLGLGGISLDPDTAPHFTNDGATKAYAAFAEGYYNITDELRVTLGGRYSYEQRATDIGNFAGPTPRFFALKTSQRAFTPRFVLAWDTGDTNLYYSFTRGFKAGGFPGSITLPVPPLDPEKISSHEVGIKHSMLDNRLRVNAAAFYYKNKDQQSQQIMNFIITTSNAGAVENYGIEVEAQARPVEGLNLGVSGAWQHARYKPFENAVVTCFDPTTVPTLSSCAMDLTGTVPPNAPEWSGSFNGSYEFAIGSWSASLSGLAQYRSSVNFAPGAAGLLRTDRAGGRFLANASGYVSPPGENVRIGFYVNNLFDKKYVARRQTIPPLGVTYNAGMPRTYGLRVEYKF